MSASQWEWFGHAAHLCVAGRCMFHMSTRVGEHIISTVGDYYPAGNGEGERETVGLGRNFETYVFPCGARLECGCFGLADAGEIDSMAYMEAADAQKGHIVMCEKWDRS